jgi:uncharacterized protein (DUF1697 family)
MQKEPKPSIYIALLRAVNVGGTGKLAMQDLVAMCEQLGFGEVKTYIASGNVLFSSALNAQQCRAKLEAALQEYASKPVGVFIRTPQELQSLIDHNPYAGKEGNRSICLFLDETPDAAMIEQAKGRRDELIACGERAFYIYYGNGMADSKLAIPSAKSGTARNLNTVQKLCQLGLQMQN